jgi:hypothetical protein
MGRAFRDLGLALAKRAAVQALRASMVSRCLAGADDQNVMTRFREEVRFPFDAPRHRFHLLAKRRMVAHPPNPPSGPGPPDGIGGGQSLESLGNILESRRRLLDRLSRRGLREALIDNLGDPVCSLFHIEIALIAQE